MIGVADQLIALWLLILGSLVFLGTVQLGLADHILSWWFLARPVVHTPFNELG